MSTSDPYWRTKEIFAEALERPADQREAWLRARCADDPQSYEEVRSMLAAHAAASEAVGFVATRPAANARGIDEFVGTMIGQYRILEVIGEGGMGVVYKAEQRAPVRRFVALKLVKLGMDTREVVARFDGERRALALMNHPNVAAVYDAGATGRGRPYFVMEYVPGTPITSFCDRHRYTTRQRLELFTQVCEAIQHAHQRAVIHRDVKPSNVLVSLVDDVPRVKVIDFGVAKAVSQRLTEHTVFTETGQLIGTPEYMSPEQAELNPVDVDTRTDIYSLGVVLYELLAGALPFESKSLRRAAYAQIQAIIREVDPPRPSTRLSSLGDSALEIARLRQTPLAALQRELRGELEWIPLKAMRKDRAQRYHTAEQFAQDIRNYLSQRPLVAGPESHAYRARKFVRRNRAAVLATAAVLLCAVAGTGLYVRNIRAEQRRTQEALAEARRQRNEARTQAAIAEAVGQFQADMLSAADPDRMLGDRVTVVDLMLSAARELDNGKLKDQPLVEMKVRDVIGQTLQSLGRYDAAEPQLRKALELRRAILPPGHAGIGTGMNVLAGLLRDQGNVSEAEPLYRETIKLYRTGALDQDSQFSLGSALNNLALLLRDHGRYDEAEPLFRESLDILQEAIPPDDPRTARVLQNLAGVLHLRQDPAKLEEAERLLRQALEMRRRSLPPGHPMIAESLTGLSITLLERRQFEEAERHAREALELRLKALPPGHPELAGGYNNLAHVLRRVGKPREAEAPLRTALEMARKALPPNHPNLALCLDNLGDLLQDTGQIEECAQRYREALEIRRAAFPTGHPAISVSLNNLATALEGLGELDDAEPLYREALRYSRAALPPGHPELARNLANLAKLLLAKGACADAEPVYREALAVLRIATADDDWRVGVTRAGLGRALAALKRLSEAEVELLAAERVLALERMRQPGHYVHCTKALADLYIAWDRAEPGRGYDAKSAQWAAKTPTTQPSSTSPATLPATNDAAPR